MRGNGQAPDSPGAKRQRSQHARWGVALTVAVITIAIVVSQIPFDRERRLERLDPEALRRAALARPNDAELFLVLGRRLRQSGDMRRAFAITNHAYDLNDHSPRFAAAMVGALVDAGEFDSAYQLGKDAMSRWPDSGEVRAQISRVYAGRGYFVDALREAEAAVRLAPGSAEAWQALGNACSLNKRPSQAYAAFERALQREPRDAELLADYGEALAKYGRAADAEARLARAVELAPRDGRALGLLGQFKASRARTPGERAATRDLLTRAAARAPRNAQVRYQLALLELRDGRNEPAARLLRSCLALDPRYGEAYLALGQLYQRTGQAAAARQAFAAWQRFSDYRREAAHLELRLRRQPGNRELRQRMTRLQEAYSRKAPVREDRRQGAAQDAGGRSAGGGGEPAPSSGGEGGK